MKKFTFKRKLFYLFYQKKCFIFSLKIIYFPHSANKTLKKKNSGEKVFVQNKGEMIFKDKKYILSSDK